MYAPRSVIRPVSVRRFTHPEKITDFTELAILGDHLDQLILQGFAPVDYVFRIDRVPALGTQSAPNAL